MSIRKLSSGKWICECYPFGRSGRRVRKQFATKGEASAFERHMMAETEAKPWLGESVDRRTLVQTARQIPDRWRACLRQVGSNSGCTRKPSRY